MRKLQGGPGSASVRHVVEVEDNQTLFDYFLALQPDAATALSAMNGDHRSMVHADVDAAVRMVFDQTRLLSGSPIYVFNRAVGWIRHLGRSVSGLGRGRERTVTKSNESKKLPDSKPLCGFV